MPNCIPNCCWKVILVDLITNYFKAMDTMPSWWQLTICPNVAYATLTTLDLPHPEWLSCSETMSGNSTELPEGWLVTEGPNSCQTSMCSLQPTPKDQNCSLPLPITCRWMAGQKWVNQEVEQFLRLFVKQYQDDYDKWLSIAEFSHNDQVPCFNMLLPLHAQHGTTPSAWHRTAEESCLEILNDFTSRMRKPWTKHIQPSPEQLEDMALFYDSPS